MTAEVVLGPRAIDDLRALHDYIADRAGFDIADGYIDRIEQACRLLENFPQRGTARDDLMPGLRTIAFERRAIIGYTSDPRRVTIQRVLYGGRDSGSAFDDVAR